eukprot:scaffold108745_cov14-Tisochrysis_lutea.AAC.1
MLDCKYGFVTHIMKQKKEIVSSSFIAVRAKEPPSAMNCFRSTSHMRNVHYYAFKCEWRKVA